MSRNNRVDSPTSYYHVILRGINKQNIFETVNDYNKFLSFLQTYKEEYELELHAWCLMSNHVHFLIKASCHEKVSSAIHKLGTKYAIYFNTRYDRAGHVFQGRFKSELIKDEAYFLAAVKYIHMNPVKAGICDHPSKYPYSSYAEYLGKSAIKLTTTDVVMSYTSSQTQKLLAQIAQQAPNFAFMDYDDNSDGARIKIVDFDVWRIFDKHNCKSASQFQMLAKHEQAEIIKDAYSNGANYKQLQRVTGVSRYTIKKLIDY